MRNASVHKSLLSLLERKQYDACRLMAEELIADQMAGQAPDDAELAHLHLILARALIGLGDCRQAAEKADIAIFLAQKVKDGELAGEARYWAGYAYTSGGWYRPAVERFTAYLDSGAQARRGEVLYNRGLAYHVMGAYSFAIPDYEAALRWAIDHDCHWAIRCRLNLAWVLIMQKEFDRAESVLAELEAEPEHQADPLRRLQVAHDRAHMDCLRGRHQEAFDQCLDVLRSAGRDYAHVRAHAAITLMHIATETDVPRSGFILGAMAKRLAGQAGRGDLDQEASDRMEQLEYEAGTDCMMESLQELLQVTPGVMARRRVRRVRHNGGGDR